MQKDITNKTVLAALEQMHKSKINPEEEIPDSTCLRDELGFDSLDILEASYILDNKFEVETPIDAEIPTTIGELTKFYQGLRDGKA